MTVDKINPSWEQTKRGKRITIVSNPFIKPSTKIFTMGSCFAREVRAALAQRGFEMYPKYRAIDFDQQTQKISKIPEWDHLNHYNTFTIRQEFELAFSHGHYRADDFILHAGPKNRSFLRPLRGEIWQDPYRKLVYAQTHEGIVDLSHKIDDCISEGLHKSDVYVITLGLTEVWRNNANGLYFNQLPHDRASNIVRFERSSYEQNYDNMRAVCALLASNFPEKKLVLTVSPVPLAFTFSDLDVVVANMESKSILRAVAAAISREFPNVIYWPSYEIALASDIYEEDGRNVTRQGVKMIIDEFLSAHVL